MKGRKCYASGGPVSAANRDGSKSKVLGAPYAKGGSKKVAEAAKGGDSAKIGAPGDAAIDGAWSASSNLGKKPRAKGGRC